MNRIQEALQQTLAKGDKAFVPYLMAGDGGLEVLPERIRFLEECGATAVEIGVPFSDPVADGPTIQEAAMRALNNGTTLQKVLNMIGEIRPKVSLPLIVMTYLNPVYAYGLPQFVAEAKKVGVDGCIIPDLPLEEEEMLAPLLREAGMELIRLVTLMSDLERVKKIAHRGQGFLYAVTVTGITGARSQFGAELTRYLEQIKEVSPIPVLAGFGISTPQQVREISAHCHGVIVGSKIVQLFHENKRAEIAQLIKAAKKGELV